MWTLETFLIILQDVALIALNTITTNVTSLTVIRTDLTFQCILAQCISMVTQFAEWNTLADQVGINVETVGNGLVG